MNFKVALPSTDHPVEVLNYILKSVSQNNHHLRNKKPELTIEPVSYIDMYRRSLSIRVPQLHTKVKQWSDLPNIDELGSFSEDALKGLCHK